MCAVGCEEDVQTQKPRPVNNQPGKAAPMSATTATQPAKAPVEPVESLKSQPQPSSPSPKAIQAEKGTPKVSKATKSTTKPTPIRKVSPPPVESAQNQAAPAARSVQAQVKIIDSLRQQSLKLQMKLDELQEQNDKLTRALLDSRQSGRTLQDNLQRSTIVQEIQKRELLELKERIGDVAVKPTTNSKNPAAAPVESGSAPSGDPMDIMHRIARLRRRNEKLQLQLQLAKLDTPDARRKVLLKLGETTEQNEKLEKLNRKLSHMVVTQADQIKELQSREEKLNNLQADHAGQIARMDRKMRKELAALELRVGREQKQIASLKDELARRESRIQTLRQELASRPVIEKVVEKVVEKIVEKPAPTVAKAEPPAAGTSLPVVVLAAAPVEPATAEPPVTKQPEESPAVVKTAAAPVPVKTVAPPIQPLATSVPVNQAVGGKITAMKGLMVMIDIGRHHGVEDGMRLITYREDKFVGYLRVEQAGKFESACTFTRQILPSKVGDNVIDRLE
ncbi:MAG: hypothetical protein JXA11_11980 [Phycisphaerae bacterium]|nr:hypothetical protein [Phycisphaerae bacterium]